MSHEAATKTWVGRKFQEIQRDLGGRVEDLESRLQAQEEAHQRALADLRRSMDNLTEFVEANQAAILDLMGKLQDSR